MGLTSERLAQLGDRFVITAQIEQVPAIEALIKEIERVQLQSPPEVLLPFLGMSPRDRQVRQEEVGIDRVGREFRCTFVFFRRFVPVPFRSSNHAHAYMRLGERIIQINRLQGSGLCLRKCLTGWYKPTVAAGTP